MDDKKMEVRNALLDLATPDGMQRFFLGTKKNGQPRAVYDVVKDYTSPKKRKKEKHSKHYDDGNSVYSFYLNAKGGKKKKHKKKKNKHWHI